MPQDLSVLFAVSSTIICNTFYNTTKPLKHLEKYPSPYLDESSCNISFLGAGKQELSAVGCSGNAWLI